MPNTSETASFTHSLCSEKKTAATSWSVRMLCAGPDMTGVKEQKRYQTRQEMHPLLCTIPRDKVTIDNYMEPTL